MRSLICRIIVSALISVLAAVPGQAQKGFPSRPITLIVPFAAGGGTDVIARLVAQKIGESLGQAVVVENRAGAAGAIANKVVIAAQPDGHTILFGTTGTQVVNPALNPNVGFDPRADLLPVAKVGVTPNLLVVHPTLGVSNVAELVALAKAQPGRIPYASSGMGTVSHLSGVLFTRMAAIDMNHIPYRGAGPANTDLIAGQVKVMFDSPISLLPLVQAGQVRALAVTSAKRNSLLPDLPTMQEAGFPDFTSEVWLGIFAPRATPRAVVAKLEAAVLAAVATPVVSARMRQLGFEPEPQGAVGLADTLAADHARWSGLIREAGVKLQ